MRQKFEGILCVLPRIFVKYDGNNRRRFDREELLEVTLSHIVMALWFLKICIKKHREGENPPYFCVPCDTTLFLCALWHYSFSMRLSSKAKTQVGEIKLFIFTSRFKILCNTVNNRNTNGVTCLFI